MKFEVEANASSGIGSHWTARSDQFPPIMCAIPPEFNGPGEGYSPEDLFGIAILNCLIATFKVYTEKLGIQFQEISGKATVTVNRNPSDSGFYMSHVDIFLEVKGASDLEKGKKVLESAVKDCAISNSIKSGKTFHLNVT